VKDKTDNPYTKKELRMAGAWVAGFITLGAGGLVVIDQISQPIDQGHKIEIVNIPDTTEVHVNIEPGI